MALAYGIHVEENAVQVYDVPARRHGELLFVIYVLPTYPASGADLNLHNDFCVYICYVALYILFYSSQLFCIVSDSVST